MSRAMVQATMPHSRPAREQTTFVRRNGAFSLALMAHPQIGLPYGSLPRLLVAYLTTEAVRTKSREIVLGKSMSEFMAHLHEVPTGGRWGSISRVKDQTMRLLSSSISCTYSNQEGISGVNLPVADTYKLWWSPLSPDQLSGFSSSVTLGERFFYEVISRPVPIDLRALRCLKKSPLALDLYVWLTYRMSYLRKATVIPWPALAAQFGAEYTRLRSFRAAFIGQLKAVLVLYPTARVHTNNSIGLTISPSPPHIPAIRRGARA
ncbi:MAG: pirin [Sphingobacteriia bacterium]|nr:pirin [Sphingobacteriia bacterium]